jgi:hypothetical protein
VSSNTTTGNDASTTTTVTSAAFSGEVDVVTEIDAPAHAVWRVLRETEHYAEWNPFIVCSTAHPDRKPQTLRPTIIQLDESRTLAWRGRLGVRGLLDAEHRLEVHEVSDQHCRFVQHERFTGLLVPGVRSVLTINTPAAFLAMNIALAQQARAGMAA